MTWHFIADLPSLIVKTTRAGASTWRSQRGDSRQLQACGTYLSTLSMRLPPRTAARQMSDRRTEGFVLASNRWRMRARNRISESPAGLALLREEETERGPWSAQYDLLSVLLQGELSLNRRHKNRR